MCESQLWYRAINDTTLLIKRKGSALFGHFIVSMQLKASIVLCQVSYRTLASKMKILHYCCMYIVDKKGNH
jgi:hypothetical protein